MAWFVASHLWHLSQNCGMDFAASRELKRIYFSKFFNNPLFEIYKATHALLKNLKVTETVYCIRFHLKCRTADIIKYLPLARRAAAIHRCLAVKIV
jgi:hypothetical protein